MVLALPLFFYWLISATPGLAGHDGYFHIKFSQLILEKGFIKDLPWLQHTIHRENYRDHHLLWHYLLAPFALSDLLVGGKVATVSFASFAGLALYFLLKSTRVQLPALWTVAALLSSHPFLFRMSLLRVQSISLAMLLLVFLFCSRKKYLLLFFTSILYVWLYDAYPLLLIMAIIFPLCDQLTGKRPDHKILIAILLGILAGMLINPYFPENITSIIYNASRSLFLSVPDMQLGGEWNQFKTWDFFKNSLPAFIMFFSSIIWLALHNKVSTDELAAVILNLLFLVLTLKSRRFVEYWPIFAFLSAALLMGRHLSKKQIIYCLLILSPLYFSNAKKAASEIEDSLDPKLYKGAALWLEKNSNPGEIIFHADWDDFPLLFFYNHHNYYVVGLDPMYLYTHDKEKSKLYKAITRGTIDNPAKQIQEEFGAKYIFLDRREHKGFFKRLKKDPYAKKVYEDDGAYVFLVLQENSAELKMKSEKL